MTSQEIRDTIKKTISQITGVDAGAISDSASFEEDLGLDSLSILEIAVNIESLFKISASEEELAAIRTVADTVDFVKSRMPAEVA